MTEAGRKATPEWPRIFAILFTSAIPVAGVFALSWDAVSVLFLYWLDAWLCMMEAGTLAARSTFGGRDDPTAHLSGLKRLATRVTAWILFWTCITILALIPGFGVVPLLQEHRSEPFAFLLTDRSIWVSACLAALPRGFRVLRGALNLGGAQARGALAEKFHLVWHRLLMVFIFAGPLNLAGPWTLKVLVLAVAGFFAYTELLPGRYAHLVGFGKKSNEGR